MNKLPRLLIPLSMLLIVSMLVSGCAGLSGGATPTALPVVQSNGNITAEGHIVPASSTVLAFTSPGQVTEVLVKAGDTVKKNAVLARLGDREPFQAAVSAAELEQAAAQRQLDDLNNQAALLAAQAQVSLYTAEQDTIKAQQKLTDIDTKDYTKRLDTAQDGVIKTKDDLKTAQENFDKVKNLDIANTARKTAEDALKDQQKRYDTAVHDHDLIVNELALAKAQVNFTKARLDDARRTRTNRQNGPDPADQTLAQARLKNAKNQLAAAQTALNRLDLTAPYDGSVIRVDLTPGDRAIPNQTVLLFADLSKWAVETSDLAEKDVVLLQPGQRTSLTADALPDLKLTGAIESISQTFIEKSGDITYKVRIPLDTPDPRLRWGMTVKVTFKVQQP